MVMFYYLRFFVQTRLSWDYKSMLSAAGRCSTISALILLRLYQPQLDSVSGEVKSKGIQVG